MDDNGEFDALLEFLKRSRGFDFTGYKRASLHRRISKRMQTVGVEGFDRYIDYLQVDPEEFTFLFNTILINVTGFFRDPQVWTYVASDVIPAIVEQADGRPIRVWSAACASGEEAYSVALLLAEALGPEDMHSRVKIYGTDIDDDALAQARQGIYTEKSIDGVPPEMRRKYFHASSAGYQFDRDIRRTMIFGRHDLVQDAPISRVDLLLCRNALMYFNTETQGRVGAHLHFALNDGGFIMLGKAEMLASRFKTFTPVDVRRRIFRKNTKDVPQENLLMMAQGGNPDAAGQLIDHMQSREAAFEAGPLSQMVIDRRGTLVLANVRARTQFGLTAEDIGKPFAELGASYRPVDLRGPVDDVRRNRRPIMLTDVRATTAAGDVHTEVDITPLSDSRGTFMGVGVIFRDVTPYMNLRDELEQANQELETAMEELQSTNEELETTNEELQSTNEELETTNEELQSTNEELETMNEELQSTNEELGTVNDEMRQRTDELRGVNAFLEGILATVGAGVIVVDGNLTVTGWNARSEDLWGLRSDEVRGQPFLNLELGLPVEGLKAAIRSCLAGEDPGEVTLQATNRRGKAVDCRVLCSPLKVDGRIDGAILYVEATQADGPRKKGR